MDFTQRLAVAESKIQTLIDKKESLEALEQTQEGLSFEEEVDLECIDILLTEEIKRATYYKDVLLLAGIQPSVSKSFVDATWQWITDVTEVDIVYRKWTDYEDTTIMNNTITNNNTIYPTDQFKMSFEKVGKAFQQQQQTTTTSQGTERCRVYLNLFLSDIILRPEFDSTICIFPSMNVTVERKIGLEKLTLTGNIDYAIGLSTSKTNNHHPRHPTTNDINVVAVLGHNALGDGDLRHCVAQAASIYKTRVDTTTNNSRGTSTSSKKVWGIICTVTHWQFIYINNDGLLWQSNEYLLDLQSYNETQVLQIYRILHYILTIMSTSSIASNP